MARIRSIKPTFFSSETLARLPLSARLTFAGLWTYCDDDGRGRGNPKLVKAALWPLEDHDVELDLQTLCNAGLIVRYCADDQDLIQVTNWYEHQRINRPSPSLYPPPPADSWSPHGALSEDSSTERNREQGIRNREQGMLIAQSWGEFWSIYPRKKEKRRAESAFKAAVERAGSPDAILAGAKRYAAEREGQAEHFTKHPTTWLNGDCWLDEGPPEDLIGPLF